MGGGLRQLLTTFHPLVFWEGHRTFCQGSDELWLQPGPAYVGGLCLSMQDPQGVGYYAIKGNVFLGD